MHSPADPGPGHHTAPQAALSGLGGSFPTQPCPGPTGRKADNSEEPITKLTNNQRAFPSLQPGPETPGCRSKLLGSPNQKLAPRRQGPARPGTWRSHLPCSQAQQPSGQAPHGQLDSRQADMGPARASGLREASEAMLPGCSGVTEPGLREEERVHSQPRACQGRLGSTLPPTPHPLIGLSPLELNGFYLLPSKICGWRAQWWLS